MRQVGEVERKPPRRVGPSSLLIARRFGQSLGALVQGGDIFGVRRGGLNVLGIEGVGKLAAAF